MRNFIFPLIVASLLACGGNESSEQYLSSAKGYLAESNYQAATIELKNALRLDANSAESRWLLGKIYLETGDVQSAEKELQRARELGWQADDLYPALAQAWLAQGKFEEVLSIDHKSLQADAAAELLSSQAAAELAGGVCGGCRVKLPVLENTEKDLQ